jgi:hypothetical protein
LHWHTGAYDGQSAFVAHPAPPSSDASGAGALHATVNARHASVCARREGVVSLAQAAASWGTTELYSTARAAELLSDRLDA